jgi:electron transport complex protein RnfD
MKFAARQAPHWHGGSSVTGMMLTLLVGLIPVTLAMVLSFGSGILANVLLCVVLCIVFEWLVLSLRGKDARTFLMDGSAVVTGALLALALPPLMPWWMLVIGCLFAIVVAKHLYGGIGFNVFNPAMVGYVVLLIAFPAQLALWPAVSSAPGPAEALHALLGMSIDADVITAATPLDTVKMELSRMRTMSEILAMPEVAQRSSASWTVINLAALAGGIWMLIKGVIRWHIPVAMLGAMGLLAFIFYALDSATQPSPVFELLSGGTMLAAFFIATDPVSAATNVRGRIIYGAGIGVFCFVLRRWGSNPDGIAFAVLLMNMAVPLIDRFTVPRIYGRR